MAAEKPKWGVTTAFPIWKYQAEYQPKL